MWYPQPRTVRADQPWATQPNPPGSKLHSWSEDAQWNLGRSGKESVPEWTGHTIPLRFRSASPAARGVFSEVGEFGKFHLKWRGCRAGFRSFGFAVYPLSPPDLQLEVVSRRSLE